MNQLSMLASIGSDLAETAKTTANTFGLNAPHFFAQVISFCIVTFLLYRFAYGPILKMLAERRQRIVEGPGPRECGKDQGRARPDRRDATRGAAQSQRAGHQAHRTGPGRRCARS